MASTAAERAFTANRPGPGAVFDLAVAVAAVAGSLALALNPAFRGSNGLSHSGSEALDPAGEVGRWFGDPGDR